MRTSPPRAPRLFILAVLGLTGLGIVVAPPSLWLSAAPDENVRFPSEDEPLIDVRVEGNTTIPTSAIAKYIKTRPGKSASPKQVQDDVKSLFGTRWFFSVEPRFRRVKNGLVLIFHVIERPIVQRVEYRGNKHVKTKYLAQQTGLKKGSPFDVSANREAARRLEQFYKEKGFIFAKVSLFRGNMPEDREVVFQISEGEKVRVGGISFEGNKAISSSILRTKLRTKKVIAFVFGGLYDPKSKFDDIAALKQYYHSLGYFDVQILHSVAFNDKKSRAYLKYTISEGVQYKVRNLRIVGNRVVDTATIRKDLTLLEGQPFNARKIAKDVASIRSKYDELGRLFAKVETVSRFLEEPGLADLVYQIDEDYVYRIRRINVVFRDDYPHTKRSVVWNRMLIHPGDLANRSLIEQSKTRLGGAQIFENGRQNPQGAPEIVMHRVKPERIQTAGAFRGQSQDLFNDPQLRVVNYASSRRIANDPSTSTRKLSLNFGPDPFDISNLNLDGTSKQRAVKKGSLRAPNKFRLERRTLRPVREDPLPFTDEIPPSFHWKTSPRKRTRPVFRGQSFDNGIRQPGSLLQGNDPNDPLGSSPRDLDLDVILSESQTGRLMFGVGVNSDAGVVGSIVLSEFNFAIRRWPRSWSDIGTAFRGNGERFRLEAVPGDQVSRYLISWTDPYIFGTDYSLSTSGFFYKRFLQDWDEQRTGGRIAVGKQLTPYWSVSGSVRLEEVLLDNPDIPTPTILANALGSSLLSTLGVSVTHDTRDSAFLPGKGHLLEFGFEQGVGDFVYPRLTLSGSQYFTIYERPDGFGRHIVTLRGQLGWTDEDTPIYERFFAGGFQTFRGFEFRGVSPRVLGVRTGGRWLAVGSLEYMLPLLANETIQGVAFTDFGTVENDIGFDQFRVTAGVGLRVTIPQMGPVPLAFDFAFPIVKEDFDDRQVFSFYVGFNR